MPLVQFKLDMASKQTRGIFDMYVYEPGNGDELEEIQSLGYFSDSRFKTNPSWVGSIINVIADDTYALLKVLPDDATEVLYDTSMGGAGMPVAPGDQLYVAFDNKWEAAIRTASSNVFTWSTDTDTSNPGIGLIKVNNADYTLINEMYINSSTLNGRTIDQVAEEIRQDDILRFAQYGAGNTLTIKVASLPIYNGDWWTIPVVYLGSDGGFANGVDVTQDYFPTSKTSPVFIESLPLSETNADWDLNRQIKLNEDFTIGYTKAKVTFSFEPSSESNNRSVVVGIWMDDIMFETEFELDPKNSDNKPYITKVFYYDFGTVGLYNAKVYFGGRGGGNSSEVGLKNVRVIVESVE